MRRKRMMAGAVLYMLAGVLAGCGAAKEADTDGGGIYNGSMATGKKELGIYGSSEGMSGEAGADGEGRMESVDLMSGAAMPGEYSEGADGAGVDESLAVAPGRADVGETYPQGDMIEPRIGLLTGGEWCDNENWGFFANLVRTGRFQFRTFGMAPYERVVVQALSGGEPAGKITVKLNTVSGSTIATAVTDHDGKAYLYYNVYGGTEQADHVVLIKPDGSQVVESIGAVWQTGPDLKQDTKPNGADAPDGEAQESPQTSDEPTVQGQGEWEQTGEGNILRSTELTVELGETAPPVRALDIMFVFDTTGSMGDELLYLQKEFEDIAKRVADQSTRFSVNFYRDGGDEYIVRSNPFSDDLKAVAALINAESANGGGDYEEAVDLALLDAVTGHTWREEAVKLMFLILDAPPHDTQETAANLRAAVDGAAAQGIRIIPIASSGVNEKTEAFLRSIAMLTGGTYTFLTDDSGIGGSHLEPTIGAYTVEMLNDMIVRLIKEYYGE